jgi:hypothetical protein
MGDAAGQLAEGLQPGSLVDFALSTRLLVLRGKVPDSDDLEHVPVAASGRTDRHLCSETRTVTAAPRR